MNKYIPDYLDELNEGLKEVCKKLDLILDAIYGEEEAAEPEEVRDSDNNEDLVIPDITLPEILPAKQVKLPNEDNEVKDTEPNANNQSAPKKRGPKPKK